MIVYAITLKNHLKDENNLPKYIWASKNQVDIIIKMRNDPDQRYNFVKINTHIFSPMDVAYIDEKDSDKCGLPLPAYITERVLDESNTEKPQKEIGSGKTMTRAQILAQEYA